MIETAQQKVQIVLYAASLLLATLGLACRLWARKVTGARWEINDYLMILAWIHVMGLGISTSLAVNFGGMGVHIWEIPKHERHDVITFSLKMTIVMPFFLICASFYAKMSITHLYIVLFKHTWLTKVCKVQFVLLTLCWLGGVIPCFVGCRPLAYTWNRTIPGGECFDLKDFWFGTSITALFFDLTCVVLPLPVVWRLKLSTAKKVRLTLVFGLGFLICGLSAARIYKHKHLEFSDLTYTAAPAMMLTVPEPSLGILAGCLPVCVPLFAKFGRLSSALKSSFNRRSNASGSQSGSDDNTKLCTGTYPNTKTKKSFISFSWNSRSRSSKSRTDVDAEAALGLPAYPATSVIVSRASSEDDYLPGICPEQIRATEEMMRLNGGSWNGITVLREVVVERERA